MQDYTILETLIKFGNLNENLRLNLWVNVWSPVSVQNKYRRELNIGSVFWSVYTEVLEGFSDKFIVSAVDTQIQPYKDYKQEYEEFDPEDIDIAKNVWVAFISLFDNIERPEILNLLKLIGKIAKTINLYLIDVIYQGTRDEEMTFWILLGIAEDHKCKHSFWIYLKISWIGKSWLWTSKMSIKNYIEILTLQWL